MFAPLKMMLSRVIRDGDLTVIDARGEQHRFGDGSSPAVTVRFADARTERRLTYDPELAAGEAYMTGELTIEEGTLYDFLALTMRSFYVHTDPRWGRLSRAYRRLLRRIHQFNPPGRSRKNVNHHYDIDPRIYDLFLDESAQYSCAYFPDTLDLASAQVAKMRHIAGKLNLDTPDLSVLDIGSGWGSLGVYLAKNTSARVKGVTLSDNQLAGSRRRAKQQGCSDRIDFELVDYRLVKGRYDRVVSVGMFEHVGANHFGTFFDRVAGLLTDDGVALLHTIGRSDEPGVNNPFIDKYIFPGGYIPALSEIMTAVEKTDLMVTDVEVLRLHYAETLRAWRAGFMAQRERAVEIAGEEFVRMWEFYLVGSECAFRFQNLVVFQLQLAKKVDTLPVTRDYMVDEEARLAHHENASHWWVRQAAE